MVTKHAVLDVKNVYFKSILVLLFSAATAVVIIVHSWHGSKTVCHNYTNVGSSSLDQFTIHVECFRVIMYVYRSIKTPR